MYRYIRSSDYFPSTSTITSAQYNNQHKYFFPTPIIPYTSGTDLHHRTHFCSSGTHVGHTHCVDDQPCTNTLPANPTTGLRQHSLKKILPWRSHPLEKESGVSRGFIGNSSAIFEPPPNLPNMVTGSNVLAAAGTQSRTLAGCKFSPKEWNINNHQLHTGAECIHNNVTQLQSDVRHCIAENSKVQVRSHLDTEKDLEKRIGEVETWTEKLRDELANNVDEFQRVVHLREKADAVLQNLTKPLDVSRENLYQRESRQGIELTHDNVEDSLFRELEALRQAKHELQILTSQLNAQLTTLRASRHELEMDISNKQYAHGTDVCVRGLNETSIMVRNCGNGTPFSHSSPSSWLANTQAIIQKSMEERGIAHSLCQQVHDALKKMEVECTRCWCQTNGSFSTRVLEIAQAIKMLEEQLQKINLDIGRVHAQRIEIEKVVAEKKPALQLAQTRLEKRKERTGLELCHDKVMVSLLQEVHILKNAIQELSVKHEHLSHLHGQLVSTKAKFENDLKLKKCAYVIDAERCLGGRRLIALKHVFN